MNIKLLEYLGKEEGLKIHRNSKESDITTMYGIYRSEHPDAKVFIEIDNIAKNIGLNTKSSSWDSKDLEKLNSFIESNIDVKDKITILIMEFYDKYLESAHLDLFPDDCIVSMFSMYVNSPLLAWKSVQFALNTFISQSIIDGIPLIEDGSFGSKTATALQKVKLISLNSQNIGLIFESNMLFGMSANYASLIKQNPDKYIGNSDGWSNRLKRLISTK